MFRLNKLVLMIGRISSEIYFTCISPIQNSNINCKLEDLTVLKRSPDLLYNVKIVQDQLRLIMKHILFYGGCSHFGQVT